MTEPEDSPPAPPPMLTFPAPILTSSDVPHIAAQPNLYSRRIGVSDVDHLGRVPLTYGDYDDNTGPQDVILVAPNGTVTSPLVGLPTERMDRYRRLNNDALWSMSIDPRGASLGFLATDLGGTWHTVQVSVSGLPVVEHGFDVAQEPNGDLYVCGSHTPDTAFVWKSTNLGATWTEVLAYSSGEADGYNRFYDFRRAAGALVVSRSPGVGHYVLTGGSWVYTPTVTFDPPLGFHVPQDRSTRVANDTTGYARSLPAAPFRWTAADALGGGYWLADGVTLWLVTDLT